MTPVRRPPRGSRAAGGNRPIQRLARGSRTRVVTSRPRRDARGRHGWGAGLERACASPGVPGLTSSLVNVWVVLGGRSSEDLLLRGRPRDVHQHFPHFEKMASFQPVTTAPQVRFNVAILLWNLVKMNNPFGEQQKSSLLCHLSPLPGGFPWEFPPNKEFCQITAQCIKTSSFNYRNVEEIVAQVAQIGSSAALLWSY
ncbi:uncharacterized protein LOC129659703 isoform X3 [Bubalus kerabau]|uniref:uncharacterized protein LOC129659703 isoform X3 n=1 Tax=Bubalus carabanensis TaxID=3119969 RepID=UPI00244EE778|nr:uncharacterized protein LOC129659703 isoform X3 [Bubalus carabanensis]